MKSAILLTAAAAACAVLISACASSAVVIGKARPAIAPEQVKVYLTPPKKFEEIALLESSSKSSWAITDQGKMNVVVARLKVEAAKLGANGVLFRTAGSEYAGSVSTGFATAPGSAILFSPGILHKAGTGVAVYVEEE